jgi:hypothetical protein
MTSDDNTEETNSKAPSENYEEEPTLPAETTQDDPTKTKCS